jgi:hypothetical protein
MDNRTERVSALQDRPGGDRSDGDVEWQTEHRAQVIRSEIARTREDMSETLDAIQDRLRPSNIAAIAAAAGAEKVANAASAGAERMRDMAQNAAGTAEEWWDASGGNRFAERMRANPVPTVMAAVGLAWLVFGGDGRRDSRKQYRSRSYSTGQYSGEQYSSGQSGSSANAVATRRRTGADVGSMLRQSGRRLETMVRDYPVAVGAAALILGASLGMVVPETERENEMMGEARDTTVRRAQEAASTAVEKAKEVAADVVTKAAIGD